MYNRRNPPEDPPCDTCRVIPDEENADALKVFFSVKNQLIMGFNGPVDINHLAIDCAMKRYNITDNNCFEKVVILGYWWIDRMRGPR